MCMAQVTRSSRELLPSACVMAVLAGVLDGENIYNKEMLANRWLVTNSPTSHGSLDEAKRGASHGPRNEARLEGKKSAQIFAPDQGAPDFQLGVANQSR